MTKTKQLLLTVTAMVIGMASANAHTPQNRDFGFGVILGEPNGLTLMFKVAPDANLHLYAGNSYFGDAKIGADYLWYFDAFNSSVVNLYSGVGGFLGLGKGNGLFRNRDDDREGVGIGARGVLGVNFIPRNTPFEIFLELGLDAAIVPVDFFQTTGAIGFRFYP